MRRGTDRQTEKLLTDFIQVANLSGPGFFLEERSLMTALISLHTVDLFELPISLALALVDDTNLETHPFLLCFPAFWSIHYKIFFNSGLDFTVVCDKDTLIPLILFVSCLYFV